MIQDDINVIKWKYGVAVSLLTPVKCCGPLGPSSVCPQDSKKTAMSNVLFHQYFLFICTSELT